MSLNKVNVAKEGSAAARLMGGGRSHESGCKPAARLMGKHYAEGGQTAMPAAIGSRRSMPNPNNQFAEGGSPKRSGGGQMQMEDHLRAEGKSSQRGSEMNKEDRLRRATGGDIGTNTGSSIAKTPGADSDFKKGGRPKMMRRAMGGAGKTRKDYPNT